VIWTYIFIYVGVIGLLSTVNLIFPPFDFWVMFGAISTFVTGGFLIYQISSLFSDQGSREIRGLEWVHQYVFPDLEGELKRFRKVRRVSTEKQADPFLDDVGRFYTQLHLVQRLIEKKNLDEEMFFHAYDFALFEMIVLAQKVTAFAGRVEFSKQEKAQLLIERYLKWAGVGLWTRKKSDE
jgi:hypothetical protein